MPGRGRKLINYWPDMSSNLQDWLLLGLSGISPRDIKILYEQYQNPAAILKYISNQIPDISQALKKVQKIINECQRKKIKILTLEEKLYPEKLKNISDPPAVLYTRGEPNNPSTQPILAVVGTRKATSYGKSFLEKIIPDLVASGFIIVSGLALGIDTMAHRLTLENKGTTWAVLGNGLNYCYPATNHSLFLRIAEIGALISEFPPGTQPRTWHFPQRNRLIAGISDGVLVVEADCRSGALITARFAADEGREVLALPGSIFNQRSGGCHWLIKEGAALVEKTEDILEVFNRPPLFPEKKKDNLKFTETERAILKILEEG